MTISIFALKGEWENHTVAFLFCWVYIQEHQLGLLHLFWGISWTHSKGKLFVSNYVFASTCIMLLLEHLAKFVSG